MTPEENKDTSTISEFETLKEILKDISNKPLNKEEFKNNFNILQHLTNDAYQKSTVLEKSEKSWKSLIQNLPDAVFRFDEQFKCKYLNSSAERLIGEDNEKLTGRSIAEIDLLREFVPQLKTEAGSWTREEKKFYIKNGENHFMIRISFEKVDDLENGYYVLITDVSDVKQTEKELVENNQKLKRVNEYLDSFVYAVAHDLRSPVFNLKSLLFLIEKAKSNNEKEVFMEGIRQSVGRLEQTLNGLIQIIEVQNDKSNFTQKVRFEEIFDLVLPEFQEEIDSLQAKVEADFSQAEEINYIQPYLISVVKNMLSNAIKYRGDGRTLQVKFTTYRDKSFTVLEIQDNGIGIDLSKNGEKLFKPFKRLTNKAQGKGIGLHIVKNMVEKNGGKIEVESQPDAGTKFKVYLKAY